MPGAKQVTTYPGATPGSADTVLGIQGGAVKLFPAFPSGTHADGVQPSGTINGANATFALPHTPLAGTLQLYRNGLLQRGGGVDYTLTTNSIAYNVAPSTGDFHEAWYRH
jgi:hypothetical protein